LYADTGCSRLLLVPNGDALLCVLVVLICLVSNSILVVQAECLAEFYDYCKGLELARNFQFPTLRQVLFSTKLKIFSE